jgi:hypothetical protein
MAKYPKFLECVNPNGSPDDLYILHTQSPRFIAKLLISDDEGEIMDFQRHFTVGGKTDYKHLSAVIGVIEFWDNPYKPDLSTQEQADRLAKLLRRCADWYHSTLKDLVDNEKE